MKKELLEKILFVSFIINIIFIIIALGQIILMFADPELLINIFTNPDNKFLIGTIYYFFFIPIIFLWIYNIRFLLKHDRYSRSILPLIFFGPIYSPIYYYKVKIKKRPLKNEIKSEPVIGRTVQLEEYENEMEYKNDLKDLEEKYGG